MSILGLDSFPDPSLLSTRPGGFQNLHCFEKGLRVKVLAGMISRGSQGKVEPVNREYNKQLVLKTLFGPGGPRATTAGRRHNWDMWVKRGKCGRQLMAQA